MTEREQDELRSASERAGSDGTMPEGQNEPRPERKRRRSLRVPLGGQPGRPSSAPEMQAISRSQNASPPSGWRVENVGGPPAESAGHERERDEGHETSGPEPSDRYDFGAGEFEGFEARTLGHEGAGRGRDSGFGTERDVHDTLPPDAEVPGLSTLPPRGVAGHPFSTLLDVLDEERTTPVDPPMRSGVEAAIARAREARATQPSETAARLDSATPGAASRTGSRSSASGRTAESSARPARASEIPSPGSQAAGSPAAGSAGTSGSLAPSVSLQQRLRTGPPTQPPSAMPPSAMPGSPAPERSDARSSRPDDSLPSIILAPELEEEIAARDSQLPEPAARPRSPSSNSPEIEVGTASASDLSFGESLDDEGLATAPAPSAWNEGGGTSDGADLDASADLDSEEPTQLRAGTPLPAVVVSRMVAVTSTADLADPPFSADSAEVPLEVIARADDPSYPVSAEDDDEPELQITADPSFDASDFGLDEAAALSEAHSGATMVAEDEAEEDTTRRPPPPPRGETPRSDARADTESGSPESPHDVPVDSGESLIELSPDAIEDVGSAEDGAGAPPPAANTGYREPSKRKKPQWWEELFSDDYLRTVPPPNLREINKQCDFIESRLGLPAGSTILDVGCGLGLHAIELTRRGYLVVGLDLSLPMLSRAGDEAQDHGFRINFLHADMREMSFEGAFDAVICIGTTFGYFDDEQNRQVVEQLYRALKPRGLLLLDVANRDFVVRNQPNLVWFEGDGCVVMEETHVNHITSRLHVKRTVILDDGRQRETMYSVRLYSLHELGQVLHNRGFRVVEVSGREATPSVFLGPDSPKLMILAERRVQAAPPKPPRRPSADTEGESASARGTTDAN